MGLSHRLPGLQAIQSCAFSFGVGIYGIVTLALITLLILHAPVWHGRGSSLTSPPPGEDQRK